MKERLKARSSINSEIETYYKVLLSMISGLVGNSKLLDESLMEYIYRTQKHNKQEIRSIGYRDCLNDINESLDAI